MTISRETELRHVQSDQPVIITVVLSRAGIRARVGGIPGHSFFCIRLPLGDITLHSFRNLVVAATEDLRTRESENQGGKQEKTRESAHFNDLMSVE